MSSPINSEGIPIHTEGVALFSKPPVNVGEEKIPWVEYRPSFITQGGYSSVQFHIPGNSTQYVNLGNSELYVKYRIEKQDGSEFDPAKKESGLPVNNILHSLWSSVDVKLNHTLVSSSGTNYMYKALIENLLNYSSDTKKIQLSSVGFSGESGNFAQTSPTTTSFNHGLRSRSE